MALNQETRAATAFKKLSGFINSQNGTSFFSEVVPSQISIATQEVIGQEIPDNPGTLTNKKKVQLELVKNSSSGYAGGKGYELAIPQGTSLDLPSGPVTVDDGNTGNSPLERLVRDFRVSGGGRRSVQIISQKFNLDSVNSSGYGYVFYVNVGQGDVIPRADDSQWQVDPVAGILTSQEDLRSNEGLAATTEGSAVPDAALEAFLFTGPTLETRVSNAGGGAGGASGLQDTQGPGIVVFSTNASTGEKSLAFDATEVITNIGSPGNTGINVSTDSTGDQSDAANYDVTFSVDRSVLDAEYLQKGTQPSPVTETTYGTYNFSGNSAINVSSGLFEADGGNNEVTISADNASLNSNGTLNVDGDIDATDPNNGGFGEVTAVDFTETSSARFKNDIAEFTDAVLGKIGDLTLRSYRFDGRGDRELGLIAEEVADVFPGFVSFDDSGRPEGVSYSRLSAVAVKGVQELQQENERLRERVSALESRLNTK